MEADAEHTMIPMRLHSTARGECAKRRHRKAAGRGLAGSARLSRDGFLTVVVEDSGLSAESGSATAARRGRA